MATLDDSRQTLRVHLVPENFFYMDHPTDPNEVLLKNFKGDGCHTFVLKCMHELAEALLSCSHGLDLTAEDDPMVGPKFRVLRINFCGKDWQQAYCHFVTQLSPHYSVLQIGNPYHCS